MHFIIDCVCMMNIIGSRKYFVIRTRSKGKSFGCCIRSLYTHESCQQHVIMRVGVPEEDIPFCCPPAQNMQIIIINK